MATDLRFAVSLPNVGEAAGLLVLGAEAELHGWDGVFLWDHLHLRRDLRLDVHDPWVLLGAMAAATATVRLGTLVTPVARRRPWKLAKEVVTLDHLSGGRVVLGVGLGEPGTDEFAAFGEAADAHERAARLDEGLAVLDGLLSGEPFRYDGEHYQVDAELHPRPVQRPRPPIWVAGKWPNPKPLARASRWDGVVPISQSGEPLRPEEVAAVADATGRRPGFDVVATIMDDAPVAEYAEAGATWIVCSAWPAEGWADAMRERILAGPPT